MKSPRLNTYTRISIVILILLTLTVLSSYSQSSQDTLYPQLTQNEEGDTLVLMNLSMARRQAMLVEYGQECYETQKLLRRKIADLYTFNGLKSDMINNKEAEIEEYKVIIDQKNVQAEVYNSKIAGLNREVRKQKIQKYVAIAIGGAAIGLAIR
jgi:hypothetical protein